VADAEPIVREVWIDADPETVFAFFTDAEKYVRWLGLRAELEARPGGTFRVDNGRDWIRGRYVEVVPFTRSVFTWGDEAPGHTMPAGSSTVEVTLTPKDGGTHVRLVHRDLPAGEHDGHAHGWDHHLGRLVRIAAGLEPGGPEGCPEEG
jgi:uncharacterized protein YndB with AHSA1/START domain